MTGFSICFCISWYFSHSRILGDSEHNLIASRQFLQDGAIVENCFMASSFISWLVHNDVVPDRYAAVTLGQNFLDILVIRPGTFFVFTEQSL